MAALVPFRALRPVPAAAERVAAVPYDVVSTSEARELALGNALSFLHVSRAEIDLPPGTDPHDEKVYDRAARNFAELREKAPLVMDEASGLYIYRLKMGGHVQTGVAGCFSLHEYDHHVVKKHEHTRPDKEDDRTKHLIRLRAQTGPVFLTYRSEVGIDDLVGRVTGEWPLFGFTAVDGIQHAIWRVSDELTPAFVAAFASVPALYIADGHHRAASAARARRHFSAGGHAGEWDTFLAVAFPDAQVQILPYNRIVRDLGGHTPAALLNALRERLTVAAGPPSPTRHGDVSMYLDGQWYTVGLGGVPASLLPDERLDVSRLHALILAPLLGIGDVRTDSRIDFVGGGRGTDELERRVESGEWAVAFSLFPVGVRELMAISDAGGVMPPKSTWFEPKLRDGLLTHLI
ncbi:MAG TPA: DUF1015 family protein [Vicinamibacterales bacterium]|nr:DUF1015 family protein [Vicinamibacterales bacterium]